MDVYSQMLPENIQFSGHETFPLRQLWLRKAYVAATQAGDNATVKKVFAPEYGIQAFGVGKNMVAAIRHWALACNVLEEQQNGIVNIGTVGETLFGDLSLDPFLEKPASAWLVHWLLAGRAMRSTTWWFVFNRIIQQTFHTDEVVDMIMSAAKQAGYRVSQETLKRDVDVCVRCYTSRRDGRQVDDAAEPLLADLGLLIEEPEGIFQFRRGPHTSLPDGIFAYALLEFWQKKTRLTGSVQATLSFDAIAHEIGSPGRVFKLDENSVGDRLCNLEDLTDGILRWSNTAGIQQVIRLDGEPEPVLIQRLLNQAYGK
jgi:hypothetical protein